MPLHPSVQKALEGIHQTGEAAKDYAPVLRAASLVASFSRLRGLSHILRAGYLAIRVARLAGKFVSAPASPSPTPHAPTVAPRGSVPPVQRQPPPRPPKPPPTPTPPSPKPTPAPRAPVAPSPPPPPPQKSVLSEAERKQLQKDFGKEGAAEIEKRLEGEATQKATPRPPKPMTMPSAEQRTSAPKSIPMPSAERRTVPPKPAKMKRPPPRQEGPKPWEGWRSNLRNEKGQFTQWEKPGWGEGKGQVEDGDDATEDREELLETTKESLATLKEILAALKQSPNEPGRRKPGSPQEGGGEGDETAPGNGGMSGLLNSAGKLGIGGEKAAEGAEVGAETAEGMGSLMELLETAGPLLGLL